MICFYCFTGGVIGILISFKLKVTVELPQAMLVPLAGQQMFEVLMLIARSNFMIHEQTYELMMFGKLYVFSSKEIERESANRSKKDNILVLRPPASVALTTFRHKVSTESSVKVSRYFWKDSICPFVLFSASSGLPFPLFLTDGGGSDLDFLFAACLAAALAFLRGGDSWSELAMSFPKLVESEELESEDLPSSSEPESSASACF